MAEMYSGLHVGQRFGSLEEFKALVRTISVRQHWELRVTRSNKKSVVIGCRSSNNCFFRVVCRANKNATYISSLQDSHNCRRNATPTSRTPARSEASHVRFLLSEIPKLFDMSHKVKAQDVVDAIKRYHGYDISMRQAQRALIRLQQKEVQNQSEETNTHDSSGEDQPDSPPSQMEAQASNSAFGSLSSQRWISDNIPSALIDSMHQGEAHRNSLSMSHLHSQSVQPPLQIHLTHQVPHLRQLHQPPEAQSQDQTSISHGIHHRTDYGVASPGQPSVPELGQPKMQTQPSSNGHPTTPQAILTNFKIEFTCTTCGALNQSFFPNHGNVMDGSFLPQHHGPNQSTTTTGGGPSAQSVQGHDSNNRAGGPTGYEGTSATGTRGVQPSWTAGTLDLTLAHTHS